MSMNGRATLDPLPAGWTVQLLGEMARITMGRTPSRAVRAYWGPGHPWLSIGDMKAKRIAETKEEITDAAVADMTVIPRGTLMMSFKLTLGRLAFAARDMYTNEAICSLRNPRVDPEYLYYALSRVDYSLVGKQAVKGYTLNLESLNLLEVPVPTPEEQRAIAATLSHIDTLDDRLTELIAKKTDVRQAVAQELLTGRTRLPGYTGAWGQRALGEVGRWKGGGTPSMMNRSFWDEGTVPWVSSGDVKAVRLAETTQHITEAAVRGSSTTLMPSGSVIVVTRSGILRRYLPVAKLQVPMAINQDIKAVAPNQDVDPEYLLQVLRAHGPKILTACLKAGTTVESIEYPWLKAYQVPIPRIDEQRAIAAVLSDADAEIASLEARLAKTMDLKQAMAQELLTGRTSLA
jgi:type I restriction enzyme S subunit